jgi:hypothetical protein
VARVKGVGLVGFPPPDRDPRPKLAPTSAPDPSAQVQQEFYWFTGECFLKKIQTLVAQDPEEKTKKKKNKLQFSLFLLKIRYHKRARIASPARIQARGSPAARCTAHTIFFSYCTIKTLFSLSDRAICRALISDFYVATR